MNRQKFKEWILETIEVFDSTLDDYTDMPEELSLEEWQEQFSIFYNNIMENGL